MVLWPANPSIYKSMCFSSSQAHDHQHAISMLAAALRCLTGGPYLTPSLIADSSLLHDCGQRRLIE